VRRRVSFRTGLRGAMVTALVLTTAACGSGSDEADTGDSSASSSTEAGPRTLADFPGPDNTGVPEGVVLTPYVGPCTISEVGIRIEAQDVRCGHLVIQAADVVVSRSRVTGWIDVDDPQASLLVEDSEVDAGAALAPAVGFQNVTVRRSELHGGQHSALCGTKCLIENSWLHGQYLPPDEGRHNNAFLTNGGSDVVVRGNTLSCDVQTNDVDGGCTAVVSIFGDFAANSDVLVESNLLRANPGAFSFCLFGGFDPSKSFGAETSNIVIRNNIFERGSNGLCGASGPATSFDPAGSGNVWQGNRWEDGALIEP
jgi:hypothetical protein